MPLLPSIHRVMCRCLSIVGASRKLLVHGSSSGVVVLSAEEDTLNNGVGQKEEAANVSGIVIYTIRIVKALTMQGS